MPNGHHVTLAIMAKGNHEVLDRAVASVLPFIASMTLVVAPGDPLMDYAAPVPTRVVEHPWEGFAKTRTATLRYAEEENEAGRPKWVLMIDLASVVQKGSVLPDLDKADRLGVDAYQVPIDIRGSGWRWRWLRNGHLMRARCGFEWKGTGASDRHEVMTNPEDAFIARHDGLVVSNVYPDPLAHLLTARSLTGDATTYEADLEALKARRDGLPLDSRTAFYYAQSLKDAGRYADAFNAFAHRARMVGGLDEEKFWAKLWMAKLAHYVGADPVELYHAAHHHSPERAEPLAALECIFRERRRDDLAHLFGTKAASKKYPVNAQLFVELNAYHPNALKEVGIRP